LILEDQSLDNKTVMVDKEDREDVDESIKIENTLEMKDDGESIRLVRPVWRWDN
jgi:hypothetical protein